MVVVGKQEDRVSYGNLVTPGVSLVRKREKGTYPIHIKIGKKERHNVRAQDQILVKG